MREFLNFRSILIAGIIKFLYIFLAVLLTIMSIVVMCQGRDDMVLVMILVGLAIMIFGNLFLRIMLELTMAIIMMWENTSDMRAALVKEEERPEEEESKESEPKIEPVMEAGPEPAVEVAPASVPAQDQGEAKSNPAVEETVIAEQQTEIQQ